MGKFLDKLGISIEDEDDKTSSKSKSPPKKEEGKCVKCGKKLGWLDGYSFDGEEWCEPCHDKKMGYKTPIEEKPIKKNSKDNARGNHFPFLLLFLFYALIVGFTDMKFEDSWFFIIIILALIVALRNKEDELLSKMSKKEKKKYFEDARKAEDEEFRTLWYILIAIIIIFVIFIGIIISIY